MPGATYEMENPFADAVNGALAPVRRLYRESPALAKLVNRAIWYGALGPAEARAAIPLFDTVEPYTLVRAWGLLALYRRCGAAHREGIEGAFVECGVWRGGCAGVMAAVAGRSKPARPVWLFDSFEGLPEPGDADRTNRLARAGEFAAPIEAARELLFDKLGADPERTHLVKGWFDATLPSAASTIGPIAVLRLDADLYESTRCCLENLYEQVSPGGYVIVDDYHGWPGCRRAVDEFLSARGERPEMRLVDPLDRARKLSAVWFRKA